MLFKLSLMIKDLNTMKNMYLLFLDIEESIDSPGSPILDTNYKGPHLNSPLSAQDLDALLDNFKQKKVRTHDF